MAPTPAPPNCPRISEADLRPGDVLLSYGDDWIARVIRKLDHGIYSHAAVWDGTSVVEATTDGVVRSTLQSEETQSYVDAYRWQPTAPDGHVLGDAAYPYQPVTEQADKIADQGFEFAYCELLLAALVIGVSNVPPEPWLRVAVKKVLYLLDAWIVEHIEKHGKRGMTCTEVVSTSFWRATPQARYAINILVDGSRDTESMRAVAQRARGAAAPGSVSDYEQQKRQCLTLFLKAARGVKPEDLTALADAHARALAKGPVVTPAGGPDVPLACVTPRDLQRSPDLKCVGRVSERKTVIPDTMPADLSRLPGRLCTGGKRPS